MAEKAVVEKAAPVVEVPVKEAPQATVQGAPSPVPFVSHKPSDMSGYVVIERDSVDYNVIRVLTPTLHSQGEASEAYQAAITKAPEGLFEIWHFHKQ